MIRRVPLFISRPPLRRASVPLPLHKRGKQSYRAGLIAEFLACLLLRLKGYRILHRRYRCPYGEIDIVAARGNVLAVVEVKKRASLLVASESISSSQKERLIRAAAFFISHYPAYREAIVRFDAILTSPLGWPRHIPNAWDAV